MDRRGEGNGTMEAETGIIQPQATEGLQPPKAGRGEEQTLPWSFWRKDVLLTPRFWLQRVSDSGLQNVKRINSCWIVRPSWCELVRAALENQSSLSTR